MIKVILFDFDGVPTIEKTGSTTITKYISANECAFINNTKRNSDIPNQMGMNTILFDDENRGFWI